jgi:hypothetical protein
MNGLISNMGLTEIQGLNKVLSYEEKEDLIDKLETKKYEFMKKGLNSTHREVDEILKLLSSLKKNDVSGKIEQNVADRGRIDSEFRKEKTELKLSDFNRMVDLTAPKGEREPDVTTAVWSTGKKTATKTYSRDVDAERIRKFQKKMQSKPMTPQMVQELSGRLSENMVKYDIHNNKTATLAVKTYDPKTFTGLSNF